MSTSTPTVIAPVIVKTMEMPIPNATSYGTGLTFDFSEDVGEGNSILAYSVGLSGFQVFYATQSNESYENVQQFSINLVPNLINNTVVVTANIVLTDYDGDAASEAQDVSDRQSYAIVTVIAIAGKTATNDWALVNIFGQAAASTSPGSPNIPIPASPQFNSAFISGFNFAYESGNGHGVLGLYANVSSTAGTQSNSVSLSGEVTMDADNNYSNNTSLIDLGLIAATTPGSGEMQNFQIVGVSPTWNSPDSGYGITGSFTQTISDIPSGYQISNAAFLMTKIDLHYGNNNYHNLGTIAAGLQHATTVTVSGNTLTGSLVMNVYADEPTERVIDSGSSLSGFVVVVFEPIPAS